jgi:hypothetical protein
MTVWIFEHIVDYEGTMDMQIFSSGHNAQVYAEKYFELAGPYEELPETWEHGMFAMSKRSDCHLFLIRPYEVDSVLHRYGLQYVDSSNERDID